MGVLALLLALGAYHLDHPQRQPGGHIRLRDDTVAAGPGGLSWAELTALATSALRSGGCRGWSISVCNPDQDPGHQAAARITRFIADVVSEWPAPG